MRTINTNDRKVENIVKRTKELMRKYLEERYVGDSEINKRTKDFVKKVWQLDEPDEPEDAPRLTGIK